MQQIGLWQVTGSGPAKLRPGKIDLEKHLESWLEADPTMLQAGLTIVGRQVRVPAGIIDLLALDPQGRWVVIEVKPNTLYRNVITQALDYASSISALPAQTLEQIANSYIATHPASVLPSASFVRDAAAQDSREVLIYVVGAGRDPGLERVLSLLSGKYSVPITVISFNVFETADGDKLLLRELSEAEVAPPPSPATEKRGEPSPNDVRLQKLSKLAERGGMGASFQAFLDAAAKHGFYPRAYQEAVMFTPPNKRTRMLFTVRAKPDEKGKLSVYVSPDPFAEFYDIPRERAHLALGGNGWRHMSPLECKRFIEKLDGLMSGSD